jgi:hypothetical protein
MRREADRFIARPFATVATKQIAKAFAVSAATARGTVTPGD